MDKLLNLADHYLFTPYIYPENLSEDNALRQFLSLMYLTTSGVYALYFVSAGLNYFFIFDKRLLKHPLILENQIGKEIEASCKAAPVMAFLTSFCFLLEVRGYSKLYSSETESGLGWPGVILSIIPFILFTDCLIYWIHRAFHSRFLYKRLHKSHHLWKVSTPFASHANHPVDGFVLSLPYHLYVFLFPMNKYLYMLMFIFVNFWAVSVHDGNFRVPNVLKNVVNGSAHHTDHHMYYNCNYGQFFTLWDKIGGSFRHPAAFNGDSPLDQVLKKEGMTATGDTTAQHNKQG